MASAHHEHQRAAARRTRQQVEAAQQRRGLVRFDGRQVEEAGLQVAAAPSKPESLPAVVMRRTWSPRSEQAFRIEAAATRPASGLGTCAVARTSSSTVVRSCQGSSCWRIISSSLWAVAGQ